MKLAMLPLGPVLAGQGVSISPVGEEADPSLAGSLDRLRQPVARSLAGERGIDAGSSRAAPMPPRSRYQRKTNEAGKDPMGIGFVATPAVSASAPNNSRRFWRRRP